MTTPYEEYYAEYLAEQRFLSGFYESVMDPRCFVEFAERRDGEANTSS